MKGEPIRSSRFFHIAAGGPERLASFEEAVSRLSQGGYVWLDYFNPTKEELTVLMAPLGLHPLSIEDCLDEDQVPKIEDFASHNFILFNSYCYFDHAVAMDEIDFFLGRNFLVTVSHGHVGDFQPFAGLDTAIERDLENVHKGPDFLLHVILDFIVDEKFKAIEALQEELDEAEEIGRAHV
jgi:magnesium transporter